MVRNRKRITDRASIPAEIIIKAVKAVSGKELSYSKAAEKYGIPLRSLRRYCKKASTVGGASFLTVGYVPQRKVFSYEEEKELAEYLKRASDVYFGLRSKEVRKFAYQFAVSLNRDVPESWRKNQQAGEDWFSNFLKRNPSMSIRRSEATNLSRGTGFNEMDVAAFFKLLKQYYDKYSFGPADIWNMDEIGISTVQNLDRVVTRRGCEQTGKMTSAENGTLVTLTVAVSAIGSMIPPLFIFPRLDSNDYFLIGAPIGSTGCSSQSGWMKEEHFILFAEHFVQYTKSTKERPTLLLLDNHTSHLSITSHNYLKENGVVVLSFPPHCSHKLQPLNHSVYGPFKNYVNTACDSWLRNNPEKTMTVFDIPSIVTTVLPLAATESNITSGFTVTGISPLKPDIFLNSEFLPCYVTNCPEPMPDSSPLNALSTKMISTHPNETSQSTQESETNATHMPVSAVLISQTRPPSEELRPLLKSGRTQEPESDEKRKGLLF